MCLLAALFFGAEVVTAAPAPCLVEGAVAEETAGASEADEVLFAALRAEMTEEDVVLVFGGDIHDELRLSCFLEDIIAGRFTIR